MLTKEQLLQKWDLAFAQYTTIDRPKCRPIPPVFQGLLFTKKKATENIMSEVYQFNFHNEATLNSIKEFISELEVEYLGIAFVQHYIIYS